MDLQHTAISKQDRTKSSRVCAVQGLLKAKSFSLKNIRRLGPGNSLHMYLRHRPVSGCYRIQKLWVQTVRNQASVHYLEKYSHIQSCLKSQQSASYVPLRIWAPHRELLVSVCHLLKVNETTKSALQTQSASDSEPLSEHFDRTIAQKD